MGGTERESQREREGGGILSIEKLVSFQKGSDQNKNEGDCIFVFFHFALKKWMIKDKILK